MGRRRKGIVVQGKHNKKECGPLPEQDRNFFNFGSKTPAKQTPVYYLPEELLNVFRQMNPHDIVNIIVDP